MRAVFVIGRRSSQPLQNVSRRFLAVYGFGDGWSGALGTGSLESHAIGHDDEEETDPPVLMYSGQATAIAAGWGHTAVVAKEEGGDEKTKLMVCGRPQDFQALLRLKRLPEFVRRPAVQHALKQQMEDEFSSQGSTSMIGRVFSWMVGMDRETADKWEVARRNSILPSLEHVALPDHDVPSTSVSGRVLDASAGLTAVIGESGRLYTFGLNHHGQCGVGALSNNVWTPEPVMGLSTKFAGAGRDKLEQQYPVISVALGLQHGVALDDHGNMYSWGKGTRGQLGQGVDNPTLAHASRVKEFLLPSQDGRRRFLPEADSKVIKIAAGMNHSAALTESNHVFIWGKNVAPPSQSQDDRDKKAVDSPFPRSVLGLPESIRVIDIACGSHHTAMLMEDGSVFAVGVATDRADPQFFAVEMIPPGIVVMPCRQFDAHFDRTTIVGKDGIQVLQVHLWSDDELHEHAPFSPAWVDHMIDNTTRIRAVQRGWLHTVVSTDE